MRFHPSRFLTASLVALLLVLAALPAFAAAERPAAPAPTTSETAASATLTAAQEQGLLYMREEEKLAHDLYVMLGDLWGVRTFERIAVAESRHEEAVLQALETYGLTDPAADLGVGEFSIPELQTLYDQLAAVGALSLQDALRVGALVEETDIADLDAELDAETPLPADVVAVYDHLRFGSTNHLRAFVRQINRQGESYVPTVLDQETFEGILDARSR